MHQLIRCFYRWLTFKAPLAAWGVRAAMIVMGTSLMAPDTSGMLFLHAEQLLRRVCWKLVGERVVHLADNRW